MSTNMRARIGRRELFRMAEDEGQVVICDECEYALDRDGRCGKCETGSKTTLAPPELPVQTRRLAVLDYGAVSDQVDARGEARFLIEGLWPEDAYGVLAAEDKAGKTYAGMDLGVSVATGTPWLNRFPVTPGPVVMFLGEGGDRLFLRRVRSILRDGNREQVVRDRLTSLGNVTDREMLALLKPCFAVPRLRVTEDVAVVRAEVERIEPRLVILDPLYLAAAGARGSDLYQMGEALLELQEVAQDAGCALVVVTHWNKTGTGTGVQRITGVGPGAWGRVLGSASVVQRHAGDDGTSTVTLEWSFRGGEINDATFTMRREVRAEDPTDLNSPLHYGVEVIREGESEWDDLGPSRRRVLSILEKAIGQMTVREIGDELARDGQGPALKKRTIHDSLEALIEAGLADGETSAGVAGKYWSVDS